MLSLLKKFILQCLIKYNLDCLFFLNRRSALIDNGWLRSCREKRSIAADGNPIPWYTYPAIHFLSTRETNNFIIFEYGSGNSTLWWASRVSKVYSCEHDIIWYNIINNRVPQNVFLTQITLINEGDYCREVCKYLYFFNIIVIDGEDRNNCIINCLDALREDGVIILDNSDRCEYEEGIIFLLNNGFRRIDLFGMGPINLYSWCTTIFYKDGNCLGI